MNELKNKYSWFSFGLTFLSFFMICYLSERVLVGSGIFIHDDLKHTFPGFYIPSFDSNFSFTSAMGVVSSPSISSPFLIPTILLVNQNIALFLTVSLKISCAAFFMYSFIRKHIVHKNSLIYVALSVSYALCSYVIIFNHNLHFLEGLYMLPLLCSLWLSYIKFKTGRWKLVVALLYSFVMNYYSAYMVGIFLAFICLNYSLIYSEKNRAITALNNILDLFVCALEAALMGFVFLFPLAVGLFHNDTVDSVSVVSEYNLYIQDFFANFFFYSLRNQICEYPTLYSGSFSLLLIIPLLFAWKKDKKASILFSMLIIFFTLISFVPAFYLGIHMFNDPDGSRYRYTYLLAFTLCAAATYTFDRGLINKKNVGISVCVWIMIYIVSMLLQQKFSKEVILSSKGLILNATIFIILYLCLFGIKKKKVLGVVLCLFMLTETFVNGLALTKSQSYSASETRRVYEAWNQNNKRVVSEIKAQDDGLYRVKPLNLQRSSFNEGPGFGYNSLSCFNPSINLNVKRMLSNLGYGTGKKGIFDLGGSIITESIFAEKYYIHGDPYNPDSVFYYTQNATSLPIAFCSAEYIKNISLTEANVFENQNGILTCLTGEELAPFQMIDGSRISFAYENCEYLGEHEEYGHVVSVIDSQENAYWKIDIDGTDLPDDVYIYFEQDHSEFDSTAPYFVSECIGKEVYQANNLYLGNILKLSKNETGDFELSVVFDQNTAELGFFKNLYVYTYDDSYWNEKYNQLAVGGLRDVLWENNTLAGKITSTEEQNVLFTSIPYYIEWDLYVDGVETDTYSILDGALLAADLKPGEHEIKLIYHDKLVDISKVISLIGVLFFAVENLVRGIRNKQKHKI